MLSGFRGRFRDDVLARALYSEGAGIARAIPMAVAVPRDAEDVAALVRWAAERGTALIPRGSGSGMAGGAVGGGVIVDLSRLDRIEPVDERERRVWVEAGALWEAVNERARDRGLRFPVDPSSGAFCTVGGMVSTNAAGAHSLRFGATRAWVQAIDCVFDDGSRAVLRRGERAPTGVPAVRRFLEGADEAIRRGEGGAAYAAVRKNSSGYALDEYRKSGDLIDVVVGSEGTLALVVRVELALAPLPGATSSVLAAFSSLDEAVDGARRARESGASACELLDRTFLDVASAAATVRFPEGTEAVLLAEVEANDRSAAAAAATTLGEAFSGAGATAVDLALDPASEAALWSLRHAASPILSRLDPALKSMQFIEDACVPPERLAEYVRGVRRALGARGIRGVIFGHAGDAHIHVNPLVDVRRPHWRDQVSELLTEITALVAALGGTLAGEHGDGRLRTPLLGEVIAPATASLFALVKRCFDPRGILNPGVKVPLAGQAPLGDIKYDPLLPPLPVPARAALDEIERARGWATFRLSLVGEQG